MIFSKNGELTLIDPIPAPFEHYWFDISKVFQDLEGRWFNQRGKVLPGGVTSVLRDRLLKKILNLDPSYANAHAIFLSLCFARILPYCNNKAEVNFVYSRIVSSLQSIV